MRPLKVKDIVLEEGRPKIAVPITGRNHDEIIDEVEAALKTPCNILEWRADYYLNEIDDLAEKVESTEAHLEMIRILDDIDYVSGGMPLIFTIRGDRQGGKVSISREHAYDLASLAAQSRLVDFVDMELLDDDNSFNEEQVIEQIYEIQSFGVRVIISYHDYKGMPSVTEINNLVRFMRSIGADICKIAGTVSNKAEAVNMIKASAYLTRGDQDPIIIIAMGEMGLMTRVAGGKYGSCISFAYGRTPTAPGQVDVKTLARLLDEYYA